MASNIEGMNVVQVLREQVKVLKAVSDWCEAQIQFHTEHGDVIAENKMLKERLESIQGTDEFKAMAKAKLDKEAAKAAQTLASIEAEKKKLGID